MSATVLGSSRGPGACQQPNTPAIRGQQAGGGQTGGPRTRHHNVKKLHGSKLDALPRPFKRRFCRGIIFARVVFFMLSRALNDWWNAASFGLPFAPVEIAKAEIDIGQRHRDRDGAGIHLGETGCQLFSRSSSAALMRAMARAIHSFHWRPSGRAATS